MFSETITFGTVIAMASIMLTIIASTWNIRGFVETKFQTLKDKITDIEIRLARMGNGTASEDHIIAGTSSKKRISRS